MTDFKPWEPSPKDADLRPAVLQALGSASMCWSDINGAGAFDPEQAVRIADGLVNHIQQDYILRSEVDLGDH